MTTDRKAWWRKARFGMFIHWSLFSLHGLGAGTLEGSGPSTLASLAARLRPRKDICDIWARLARAAGMKYAVLTVKHNDGFKLWESRTGGLSSVQSCGRDLVREFVSACRKHGLAAGFYFALPDLSCPAYTAGPSDDAHGWSRFVQDVHEQVRELMSGYGAVDILWYDTGPPLAPEPWRSGELNAMVRRLQPKILINDRSFSDGDFSTPEQEFGPRQGDWEGCEPLSEQWEFRPRDHGVKTPSGVVMRLVKCANGGGNYLPNVSPRGDGSVPDEQARVLRKVEKWLKIHGESVYGTMRAGRAGCASAVVTIRPDRFHLHFPPDRWHDRYWFGSLNVDFTGLTG